MYEVCRGYRDTLEALLQERKTSEKAYKEKNDLEKSQLTDKITVLEATISREKSKAKKYNESCRETWQDTDGLREELSRAHEKIIEQDKKVMEQDKKIADSAISREKEVGEYRKAWQDIDRLREELSRAYEKVMEQDKKITDNAISREKQVGEYREAIGVLKERLANKKSAADDFEKEKKRLKMELDDLHGSYKESLREKEKILREKDAALAASCEEVVALRKECNDLCRDLREKEDTTTTTLREKEDIQKKALEAVEAEFEKELNKLRDESSAGQKSELLNLREKLEAASRDKTQLESENVDIKRQLGELRAEFQLSELRAGRARETQLETDRANIERQLNELRAQRDQEARAIPVRLTPSSREEPRGRATPVAVPSFSGALLGPPESTPSSRRKGSALENPKEKMFRMYSSPAATPYTSPYGSRAPSVFEESDDEESPQGPARPGSAAGLPATPDPAPAAASVLDVAPVPGASSRGDSVPVPNPGASSRGVFSSVLGGTASAATSLRGAPSEITSGLTASSASVSRGASRGVFGQTPSGFAALPAPASGSVIARPSSTLAASLLPVPGGASAASSAASSSALGAALGPVGFPHMMATPVEFIATGDMKTGVIAESVSLGVIEITTTKIAE
ncbi:hypothetical protein V496_01000 [Pseudogymnoascus sp. VKM F-4515 (FW-2607)]|nr:hypothetical protein V496_01000 [Pseudogymnoascus sp. VKM F-4515 (FW-2607)]